MKKPETPPSHKIKMVDANDATQLMKVGKWDEFVKISRDDYPYWEELKYKTKEWKIEPGIVWAMIKNTRRYHQQYIQLTSDKNFLFTLNIPGFLQKHLHELDMNLGGILQSENIIPSEDKDRYLISSIMEEAIASSQLEGAATTRKVAREMLEKERKPQNKSERMIMNNYDTMRWIVENKNERLTPEILLSIHALITKETLGSKEEEGFFRNNDDVTINEDITNEVFYIPPSHKQLQQLVKDFCKFANDEDKDNVFIHPVVKGIILHFLIGYIHPFTDGNGRTARAIFYWYLIRKGYWLVEYMSISRIILKAKSQYARAYLYTEYDENDLTYFIIYNIKCILEALEDLKKYIHKKTIEKKNTLALVRDMDFNDRQVVLVKDILQDRNQYFTVKQIESRFNVSNQTARNDLTGLVKKGIFEQKATGKKVQFFATSNFEKKLNIKK